MTDVSTNSSKRFVSEFTPRFSDFDLQVITPEKRNAMLLQKIYSLFLVYPLGRKGSWQMRYKCYGKEFVSVWFLQIIGKCLKWV
jgi:hypothetical protein